jgi:hypothetical protein
MQMHHQRSETNCEPRDSSAVSAGRCKELGMRVCCIKTAREVLSCDYVNFCVKNGKSNFEDFAKVWLDYFITSIISLRLNLDEMLTSPVNSALFEKLSPDSQLLKYFCSMFSNTLTRFSQTFQFYIIKHFTVMASNISAHFSKILNLNVLKHFSSMSPKVSADILKRRSSVLSNPSVPSTKHSSSMLSKISADVLKLFSSIFSKPSVLCYEALQLHVLIASVPCF